MAEVDAGKLAEQKGHADAAKAFARRMVEDHSKANDKLTALAKSTGVALPAKPDEEHRAMKERLESASGAAFDRAYASAQVADHQKTVQLFEYEIGSGQNADLKRFAADTLPTLMDHLEAARQLEMATAMPTQASSTATPQAQGAGPRSSPGASGDGHARKGTR
jgi:putative membrane protein